MIEFKNVKKVYKNGTIALDGIDLTVQDGEFVFIVGQSGAGKSTLMKLLLREEKLTSGTLTVGKYDLSKMSFGRIPRLRRKLGVVFQDFRLFEDKTVYENIAFAMRVIGESGKSIRRRIPLILRVVNLEGKQHCYPNELSGGEQQRVALGRALANNPDYIIADEPTGNIDPELSMELMNTLVKIHKLNKTVIVVTHEQNLVDHFKKRVVTISNGKIVSDRHGEMFKQEEDDQHEGT